MINWRFNRGGRNELETLTGKEIWEREVTLICNKHKVLHNNGGAIGRSRDSGNGESGAKTGTEEVEQYARLRS